MNKDFLLLSEHQTTEDSGQPQLALSGRHERGPGKSGGAEQARAEVSKVIQSVFLAGDPNPPQLVLFTAVEHGNGCSWVCANIAHALASHTQASVCLINANARFSSLRHAPGNNGECLTELRLQPASKPASGVHVVSMQALSPDFEPALMVEQLHPRLLELRREFMFVLVDGPPVNEICDVWIWGRMADGVVLVLEADCTRREAARKAKERLEAAKVKLLGAILNKRTFPIPDALYKKL